jgi:hypothetical protein
MSKPIAEVLVSVPSDLAEGLLARRYHVVFTGRGRPGTAGGTPDTWIYSSDDLAEAQRVGDSWRQYGTRIIDATDTDAEVI